MSTSLIIETRWKRDSGNLKTKTSAFSEHNQQHWTAGDLSTAATTFYLIVVHLLDMSTALTF